MQCTLFKGVIGPVPAYTAQQVGYSPGMVLKKIRNQQENR